MATVNPRINITINPAMLGVIERLAKKEKKSLSSKASELLAAALEMDEDVYYAKLCDERMKNNKRTYTHEEAWK